MSFPNVVKPPAPVQLMQWIADPVNYMEAAAKQHSDVFTAQVTGGRGHLVFVHHPQGIQQLLTQDTFAAPGEVNRIIQPLVGDYSVIMLEGDRHRRERHLLMPPFHGERMQAYGELICHLTETVMEPIPVGEPFLARTAMQNISLGVILEAVFGVDRSDRLVALKQLLAPMTDIFRSPLTSAFLFFETLQRWEAWSPWGYFLRQRQQVDDILYAKIAERRSQTDVERTDILSLLMAARDEQGQPMTPQELRDELMTLMFAGHETTATAMAWALYWIHRLPNVRDKLLGEIAGESDPLRIARLPYLTAVCQETLRIYPVGMLTFPRVVQKPVELMGYPVEPGAMVVGCIYLVHQREDLYPEPKQFKPERFLERKFSNWEFLPFGGGARRCIGEALALYEMKLVLATILSRYRLALVDRRPERPQRRGLTLAPASGVKMVKQ